MFENWESKVSHAFTLELGFGMDSICGQYTGAQREDSQNPGLNTPKNEASECFMLWIEVWDIPAFN